MHGFGQQPMCCLHCVLLLLLKAELGLHKRRGREFVLRPTHLPLFPPPGIVCLCTMAEHMELASWWLAVFGCGAQPTACGHSVVRGEDEVRIFVYPCRVFRVIVENASVRVLPCRVISSVGPCLTASSWAQWLIGLRPMGPRIGWHFPCHTSFRVIPVS